MQLGFGLLITTPLVSIVLMYFVEFPILRIMQLYLLPYLSHDKLLRWHLEDGWRDRYAENQAEDKGKASASTPNPTDDTREPKEQQFDRAAAERLLKMNEYYSKGMK